jgi:peptidoglycan hydrolase CwlO-like protein
MEETARSNGNGWKTAALGALWAVLMAMFGWIATSATTANADLAKTISADQQRIAILEESQRNMRDSLKRIEDGVNELRHSQIDQRR